MISSVLIDFTSLDRKQDEEVSPGHAAKNLKLNTLHFSNGEQMTVGVSYTHKLLQATNVQNIFLLIMQVSLTVYSLSPFR